MIKEKSLAILAVLGLFVMGSSMTAEARGKQPDSTAEEGTSDSNAAAQPNDSTGNPNTAETGAAGEAEGTSGASGVSTSSGTMGSSGANSSSSDTR